MAETNLNAYVNACAGNAIIHLLTPIAQALNARGVQITVDELTAIAHLPAAARAAVAPAVPAPAVPTMAFGGAVPAMAPTLAPTANRKNTATTAPIAGRTCMYQYKRGEKKNMYCGKATAPGADYCNSCLKTRKNLTKDLAAGVAPGAAPGMGGIPGMAGMPPGYTAPVPAAPNANGAAQGGQLNVVPYDEARGLFHEPTHHFIVKQLKEGVIVVIGRLNEATNAIVPLTAQEQATAQAIGLVLAEGAAAPGTPTNAPVVPVPAVPLPQANPVPIPAIPAVAPIPAVPTAVPIPAIPAVVPIPAIPTAVPVPTPTATIQPNTLAGTGQPALPTIPPLAPPTAAPAVVAPAVPVIPQIPQIPQM